MKKKLLVSLLSVLSVLMFGCSPAVSLTFTRPWIDETGPNQEVAVYDLTRTDPEGTETAKGEMTVSIMKAQEKDMYSYTVTYELTFLDIEQNGDLKNKKNTFFSEVVFSGASSSLMRIMSAEKKLQFDAVGKNETPVSLTYKADYGRDAANASAQEDGKITYTYGDKKDAEITIKAKELKQNVFDSEQLLLLARSSSEASFKPSASYNYTLFNVADMIYLGTGFSTQALYVSFAETAASVKAHADYKSPTIDKDGNISCLKATISIPSAMGTSKGPVMTAFYAENPKVGHSFSRILVMYQSYTYNTGTGELAATMQAQLKSATASQSAPQA